MTVSSLWFPGSRCMLNADEAMVCVKSSPTAALFVIPKINVMPLKRLVTKRAF